MNILHIHDQIINKGGTEVYLADLQHYLPQYGCNSFWIGIQNSGNNYQVASHGEEWKTLDKETLKAHLLQWMQSRDIQLACIHNLFDSNLVAWITSIIPVIKFSHSPVLVCPGRDKYWRFSGKPCTAPFGIHCFYHIYAQGCSNRHPKRIWKAWHYVKDELERAKGGYRKVIVMSDYNRDRLLELGVPENTVVINPYFTREIPAATSNPDRIRRLLFIGRIINGKGLPEMLDAVEPLLKKFDDVQLDIIGNGLQMEEIKSSIAEKKLEGKIVLHGWVPREEIDRFLASCYLIIFPSVYPESFGIVGIEGMMNAKPVVGFDVGGVSTWLKNKETGYLLPAGNSELMRQAIEELLTNETVYKKMSGNARTVALTQFTPKVHIEKLVSIFQEAINA